MPVPARRLACGLLLGGALLAGGTASAPVAAQTSCDPSYPDFCIAPPSEVGDLDCSQVAGAWFTVYQPDPHGFDADSDGYGCEGNAEDGTSGLSGTQGIVTTYDESAVEDASTARSGQALGDTLILDGPGGQHGILAVAPVGSVMSVDGDPVDGYYPVTYDGVIGWTSSGLLQLADGGTGSSEGPIFEGPAAMAAECDASYPDLCIPPGSADLNCDYIYGLGMSHITVYAPDPYGFDGDGNGIGCEG